MPIVKLSLGKKLSGVSRAASVDVIEGLLVYCQVLRLIKELEVEQGPIDVVVANAGIAGGGENAVLRTVCTYLSRHQFRHWSQGPQVMPWKDRSFC